MTTRKTEKIVETVGHAFEDVLGVPANTTELSKTRVTSELAVSSDYDEKDVEIEEDIVDIQDKALELHETLLDEIDQAEQSKKARLAEVAGQLLNTALSATEKRRVMKQHIDLLKQKDRVLANRGGGGGPTNTIAFVGSLEDALDAIDSHSRKVESEDTSVIEHDVDDEN
jgi:hypothetical protein